MPKRKTVFNAPYVKSKQCRLTEYFPPTTEAARVGEGRPKERDQVLLTEEVFPQVIPWTKMLLNFNLVCR